MSNLTLYELAREHRALAERLQDLHDDPQTILDTLEGEAWPLEQKTKAIAYVFKEIEAFADGVKKAEEQIVARRRALEHRAERLREYLKTGLQIAGINKVDAPEFSIALRTNNAKVDVFEPALLPDAFWRVPEPKPEPDKTAIADALKRGDDVPGARLVREQRVDIK